MAVFIIALLCSLLCSMPLLLISFFSSSNPTPITFWAGDRNIEVSDVKEYNKEMSILYRNCAIVILVTPVLILFNVWVYVAIVIIECTLGLYVTYRKYVKILSKYRV